MTPEAPTTEAGRRLLSELSDEPILDIWGIAETIITIEDTAREQEHQRLARLGAERTTPEAQAAALRKYNPDIVAAIEAAIRAESSAEIERLRAAAEAVVDAMTHAHSEDRRYAAVKALRAALAPADAADRDVYSDPSRWGERFDADGRGDERG